MATWDERYGGKHYAYGTRPNDFLSAHAARIPKGRVLCLADGEGRNGVHLAGLGYEVTSVDSSSVGLAKARRLAEARGLPTRQGAASLLSSPLVEDAMPVPSPASGGGWSEGPGEGAFALTTVHCDLAHFNIVPGAWQGIVSIFCHLPSDVRRRVHARVVQGLAPGGIFLLESYRPEQLNFKTGGPPDRDRLPTLAELKEELSGLALLHAVETERDVVEGTLHTGKAAVVQVLARKSPSPFSSTGGLPPLKRGGQGGFALTRNPQLIARTETKHRAPPDA
jgi:SAM-dependent methyltransferase